MKIFVKPLIAVSSACVMLFALAATANNNQLDYRVQYFSQCNLVADMTMNESQISAYKALQIESTKMEDIKAPDDSLENQIDELASKINELTAQVHQEDGDKIVIDKVAMKEQNMLSIKLNKIVTQMQPYYDALREQGDVISDKADRFERAIKGTEPKVDYDQVRILSPQNAHKKHTCYTSL